jgi:phosphopantothenoylcysteine decarboxylase/phosphopantothenate--cysteine ligase
MGGDENAVHLVTRQGVEDWPRMSKARVAEQLVARIAAGVP